MANKLDLPFSLERRPLLQTSRQVFLNDLLRSGRSRVQNPAEAGFPVYVHTGTEAHQTSCAVVLLID